MLSAFAAPGNLPEVHEREALITKQHRTLVPRERLLGTVRLDRTPRAEQTPTPRPCQTHTPWRPQRPLTATARPWLQPRSERAERRHTPGADALCCQSQHTNTLINSYPCPCPALRGLYFSAAISSVVSDHYPLPQDSFLLICISECLQAALSCPWPLTCTFKSAATTTAERIIHVPQSLPALPLSKSQGLLLSVRCQH